MERLMNLTQWQSQPAINAALAEPTIAVVGLSSNPARPSNDVARVMQQHGYRIVPINPSEDFVLGERSFPDLTSAVTAVGPISLVNVFRESSAVPSIAAEALSIGAEFLWLQLGVVSEEGIQIAVAGGMTCVVDRCLKVEYLRRNAKS